MFYNKGICKNQKKAQCANGLHQCFYTGCNKKVPYIECSHWHGYIKPAHDGQCEATQRNKRPNEACYVKHLERPSKVVSLEHPPSTESSSKIGKPGSDRKLVFIEFCAGSASLSAAMMRVGFHSMPVDFAGNKFQPRSNPLMLI